MSNQWLDFAELRQRLDFAAVLKHYGVELKVRRGNQHQGFCPLPTHQGQKRSPSFSANLDRKIWKCFGCGASGNCIDFAARMEGVDPANGKELRRIGLLLAERFGIQNSPPSQEDKAKSNGKADEAHKKTEQASTCPVIVNAPLDFKLQGLDQSHPYLKERGFTTETIVHFGIGYCERGLMARRIAVPLHDGQGRLIGYAGRLVDDVKIDEDHPKYLFPGPREREGKRYEVHKSLFLFNQFNVGKVSDLIVVEGFMSVFWLWQHGYANVVALMGWSCSQEQAQLIVEMTGRHGRVWLLPDGDEAGERCAQAVLPLVAPHRLVRWLRLEKGEQPSDCTVDELDGLLAPLEAVEGGRHAIV